MKTHLHTGLFVLGLIVLLNVPIHSSAQGEWIKYEYNPILNSFASWNNDNIDVPEVIFHKGVYKMWFNGESLGLPCQIGYAESPDGIEWDCEEEAVISSGTPGTWDYHRMPGSVIIVDDTMKMWYNASIDNYIYDGSVGYAWSLDGKNWNLHGAPVLVKGVPGNWDDLMVFMPAVYYDSVLLTYHMWYAGWKDITWENGMGYATSINGIDWEKWEDDNPVFTGKEGTLYSHHVIPGSVIYSDDEYLLWFSGKQASNYQRIFYAISEDGLNWEVQNNSDPVLDLGEEGEWDQFRVRFPSVLKDNGQYKMWFDGNDVSGFHNAKIGYAWIDYPQGISEQSATNSISIFPNPTHNVVNMHYNIYSNSHTNLTICDAYGKIVEILVDRSQQAGEYNIKWNVEGLASGIYFYRLTSGEETVTGKLLKR